MGNLNYHKLRITIFNNLFIASVGILFPFLVFLKGKGSQPDSAFEIIIWMVMFFFLSIMIVANREIRIPPIYTFLVMLLIVYQVLLALTSNCNLAAANSILIHNKYLLLSFLTPFFVTSAKEEKRLVVLLVCVSVVTAYFLLYQMSQASIPFMSIGGKRLKSIFPNSSMMGVYISCLLFLQFLVVEIYVPPKYKLFAFLLIIAPSLASLVLGISRRAWIAFSISFLIYAIIKKNKRFLICITLLLLVAIAWKVGFNLIYTRIMLTFNSGYESNSIRISQIQDAFDLLSRSPLFILGGIGVGIVGPAAVFADSNYGTQVDSYVLQLLLEFGIMGLLLYVSVLGVVFLAFLKSYRAYRNNCDIRANFVLAYFLALLVLIISGLAGSTPITFPLNMLQWLLAGLILKHYSITAVKHVSLKKDLAGTKRFT